MRYKFILSLLILIITSCVDQKGAEIKSDKASYNIVGNVHKVKIETFNVAFSKDEIVLLDRTMWARFEELIFSKEGDLLEKNNYNFDESLSLKQIFRRSENRSTLTGESFDDKGELFGKDITRYDEEGKMLLMKDYNSQNILTRVDSLTYDDQKRLLRKYSISYPSNVISSTNYKYNSLDQLLEETTYEDEDFRNSTKYTYDKKGNVLEKVYFRNLEVYETSKGEATYFLYDKEGNVLEEFIKYDDGAIKLKISYTYNSDGKITESIWYDNQRRAGYSSIFEPRPPTETKTTFTYNSTGNLVRKLMIRDGIPETVELREIIFYE